MQDDKQPLTKEKVDAARVREERSLNRFFLFLPLPLLATFGPLFSEELGYSGVERGSLLDHLTDFVGDAAFVYAVAISYSLVSFMPVLAWRWKRSYWVILLLFWLSWGWFYFAVFFEENLKLAYQGVFSVFLALFIFNWGVFFIRKITRHLAS